MFWLVAFGLLFGSVRGQVPLSPTASSDDPSHVSESRHGAPAVVEVFPKAPVTNVERRSVTVTSYDLDVHLVPAGARLETHALLMVRNVSRAPVSRFPLQITSTLRWQTVSLAGASTSQGISFTQSPITTDADHTGYAEEAVFTLSQPLASGASVTISAIYAGVVEVSTARLELLGTPAKTAALTDWDGIAPTTDEAATALRGFGQVLWYPVAEPTALLGEGNELFEAVAGERLRDVSTAMRLRLTVDYTGDPPDAAIFNGQFQPLTRTPDLDDQLVAETNGIATADFTRQSIGFRVPSLFLTAQHGVNGGNPLVSVITPNAAVVDSYVAAVHLLEPLMADYLGAAPNGPLLVLDHLGQPFGDGHLIVAHLTTNATPEHIAPEIVRGLTHAYLSLSSPWSVWLDQGVPELMSLLWLERTSGREAAIRRLQQDAFGIALVEPDLAHEKESAGQPLLSARSDVYLRLKSAAVLWQLRDILGDELFRRSLIAFRHSLALNPALEVDPAAFQRSFERTADRSLGWFFDDWVNRDRGLPDLAVSQLNPRPLPSRPGKSGGYLVAVEVRNEGDAVAEVPVTVSSGALTATERLRIAAHSSASTRILFEGTPETLQVNDGGVPELRSSVHTLKITAKPAP